MAIYRLTSRQQALADVKAKVVESRAELQGFEGEFDGAVAHSQAQSRPRRQAARAHLHPGDDRLVPGPVHPGLDVQRVRCAGPGGRVDRPVEAPPRRPDPAAGAPGRATARPWRRRRAPGMSPGRPRRQPRCASTDSDGRSLLTLPTAAPVRTVHQRQWWNSLIGNPGGYLPSRATWLSRSACRSRRSPVRPRLAARLAAIFLHRPDRAVTALEVSLAIALTMHSRRCVRLREPRRSGHDAKARARFALR